ncbi:MAG: sugar phosphate nucleotidyltransferase [Ferruginibacter sp.]
MIKKAMIFSAGLGTRFKPWTEKHPKALAIVNGKTLLQRNIEYLQQYGINEIVINIHHFAEQVYKAVSDNNGWGANIFFSDETNELLETGGGLLHARKLLEGEKFVTLNVDFLTNLNLTNIFEYHNNSKSLVTIAVTKRKSSRYLLFDDNDYLCGWRNKNTNEEIISFHSESLSEKAFSCVTVYEPEIFDCIKQRGKFSITETFLDLAKNKLIKGFDHTGDKLIDVGKPESVIIAENLFA